MKAEKRRMTEPLDYAPWITGMTAETVMPTTHLPDDVVATPFLLIVDSRTGLNNPRHGGTWFSLQYGNRANPIDLTDADREYIIGALKYSLSVLSSGKFTGVEEAEKAT